MFKSMGYDDLPNEIDAEEYAEEYIHRVLTKV